MKGERYIDARNGYLVDLARRLAYADLPGTLSVYDELLHGGMRLQDIALLGCLDRFFLCVCILGRRDLIHPWLYDRCREVEAAPDGYLDLWAREHGKSSLITCAGVIQEILIDPEFTVCAVGRRMPCDARHFSLDGSIEMARRSSRSDEAPIPYGSVDVRVLGSMQSVISLPSR